MHFSTSFVSFLTLSSALAAPSLKKRDAATVESDISTLVTDVTGLDTQIHQFDGSQASAFFFLIAYNQLKTDIEKTTSDVTASGTFSAADSATIVNDATPLVVDTITALNDLIAINGTVATGGYTSQVLSSLQTLQTDNNALFSALETAVDASQTSTVQTGASLVNTAMASAIAAYSS